MKVRTLMYHDVIEPGHAEASGFPGADAAVYKLSRTQFATHLETIAAAQTQRPIIATDLLNAATGNESWLITFDDGGASAHTHIADMLEKLNWRGHFFITTNYIGRKAFLSRAQLRDLRARGHVLGSHSCSHPPRISHCSPAEMLREWQESIGVLSDILGEQIDTASVPGGFYSQQVAAAASDAGCKILFTSEPVTRSREVDDCLILGRYAIQQNTDAQVAAGLAAGHFTQSAQQTLLWNAKKIAKRLGGEHYIKLRKTLLQNRASRAGEKSTKDEG
jgi:peptidoglycan/xylan/chitin deacetylase (PgdA/CDA1 family)